MSIGLGIFLFVVGAILAFALNLPGVTWINLDIVGWLLMGAGVVIVIIGIILITRKRTSSVTTSSRYDAETGQRHDTTTRRDPNDYQG